MRVKIPRRAVPVETSVLAPNLRPGRTHWCWGAPLPATATTVVGVRWMVGVIFISSGCWRDFFSKPWVSYFVFVALNLAIKLTDRPRY